METSSLLKNLKLHEDSSPALMMVLLMVLLVMALVVAVTN